MVDPRRVLPTLVLGLCLVLPVAGRQEQPPPEPPPAAPEENPAQPTVPTPTEPVPDPAGGQTPPAEPAPAEPPPAVPAPAPSGPPGAGPDRLDFTLKTEDGGIATGSAGDLEYVREDYVRLVGGVQLKYQDVDIKAAQAELDLETQVVTAQGEVILDQGPRRLTGDTLNFNLETKTGNLTNATAHVAPDYYFEGREIVKTGDDTYQVTDGTFTSCNQEVPDWSFRLGTATVDVGGYARVRHASMRAKRLPVFYTPYILWPVKEDRTSGLLIPNIGYSDRRGASLGLAYYQVLGRSYDTTFHVDLYSQEYLGLGNEFRYRPSEGTRGHFLGYVVRDPEIPLNEEWRWKLEWNHETTDLPWGMRGVVNYQEFSDFNFFQDFERDFDRNTLRFIDNRAFASGNWGPHLLNLLVQDRQTFITQDITDPDSSIEQRKLPEVEYRLRSTRIGRTPLYAQFEGSAAFLDIFRPNGLEGQYGRFDLFPQLTLPIRTFPWLSLSVSGGGRFTWWGDTLTDTVGPDGQRVITNELDGETLTRTLPFASAQIVGPSFSRIFDAKIGSFGRFKHVIEPRWTWNYLGDFEEEDEIPSFDEVDNIGSNNRGRLALANRVLGKPADGQGSAREIFLFEIARNYSFDDELPLQRGEGQTAQEGPLEALVRFTPTAGTSIKAEVDYNTLFSNLDSTSLSGNLGLGGGNAVGLTWFTNYNAVTGEAVNDQVRLTGSVAVWPDRLRFEGQINYDVEQGFLQQQTYVAYWTQQCYSLRLEWRDFQAGVDARIRDRDFRFSLSLKNVGTFLDLTSRSSTREP